MGDMTGTRSYGEDCGLARALDAVGERWALLIVRELLYGPRRFSDLRAALGASPNVLSQRLEEMLSSGVVQHRRTGAAVYDLTERGHSLRPILLALARWGTGPGDGTGDGITTCALLLALESRYTPAPGLTGVDFVALHLGDERFLARFDPDGLTILRDPVQRATATIQSQTAILWRCLFGDRSDRPAFAVLGEQQIVALFLKCFPAA